MITMTKIGTHGRLANQLFQYAFLRGICEKHGYTLKLPPNLQFNVANGQQCLLLNFKLRYEILQQNDVIKHKIEENCGEECFQPELLNSPDNTDFFGLFQSFKYFHEFKSKICAEFSLSDQIEEAAAAKIKQLKQQLKTDRLVSVHLRRGDFTNGMIPELMDYYGKNNKLETDSAFGRYFLKVKNKLDAAYGNNYQFLFFTGGSPNNDNSADIQWVKDNFKEYNPLVTSNPNCLHDFCLMKHCDDNIITHGTTFSWWAAYLNPNSSKKIFAPENFYFNRNLNRSDFYPSEFIQIEK